MPNLNGLNYLTVFCRTAKVCLCHKVTVLSYFIQTPSCNKDSGATFAIWAQENRACMEVRSQSTKNRSEKRNLHYFAFDEFW